ncbi:uncharacterized protein LOC103313021 isoform X2 [Tribolium castaneum]|nr:PREDICTED: uncharacterized protein LOC103313021 isoform X2 [Tribolium castaneum]XP_015839773.1 PREDICTED: uncharacterized protein LOC103313021 isoform X2 [Tribolium castaneum]XP_015839774.1 PREDICTED: uncharacterized protein LOC103313021 isoform X2 [Tribolium castaneum]|eukprot:XP_015839772.1 PREDICTED: uncharacterized protein LOC103313021 isoform X2 [Tribolium castaneum]
MKCSLVLILLVITLSNGQVVTLKNMTHVYCVNGNPDSPSYVFPFERKKKSQNGVILNTWKREWMKKNATTLPLGSLTDRRWEDLPFPNASVLKYTSAFDSSFSFSVFSNTKWVIRLVMSNDSSPMDYEGVGELNRWTHYSIVSSETSTYIYKNNKMESLEQEFKATYFILKSSREIVWRPHIYEFLWSNFTSPEPFTLEINPKKKTCILLYTSLGADSFLEVSVNNENNFRIIQNKLEENGVQLWQTHKIDVDPIKRVKLSFTKKTFNQNIDGFWAIDIKLCGSYTEFFDLKATTNTICYELNNNFDKSVPGLDFIRKNPGVLVIGANYKNNIYCSDVLGRHFLKCEKHKICVSNHCGCSWGFEGENCSNECATGRSGLSCTERSISAPHGTPASAGSRADTSVAIFLLFLSINLMGLGRRINSL